MNILSKPGRVCGFIISCYLLAPGAMANDDGAVDSEADSDAGEYLQLENCIQRSGIRRTDIVDDSTILFYMAQKKIYVNQLPRRCRGLRIADTFGYRTYGSRLCNVDMITVIRTGGGLSAGPSCGLGKFRPVTKEEAAMIKNKEAEIPPQESVPVEDAAGENAEEIANTEDPGGS